VPNLIIAAAARCGSFLPSGRAARSGVAPPRSGNVFRFQARVEAAGGRLAAHRLSRGDGRPSACRRPDHTHGARPSNAGHGRSSHRDPGEAGRDSKSTIEALKRSIAGCRPCCEAVAPRRCCCLWFRWPCSALGPPLKENLPFHPTSVAALGLKLDASAGQEGSLQLRRALFSTTIEASSSSLVGQPPTKRIQCGRTGDSRMPWAGRPDRLADCKALDQRSSFEAPPARGRGFTDPHRC